VGRKSWARGRVPGAQVLSRRKIVKRIIGLATVVAAGGPMLTRAISSPAAATRAAILADQATVEQGAVAPAVVNLADAAPIAVDASLGNDFRVTIGGNRTMGSPANPAPGQQIIFQITQGTGGPYSITWDTGYEFSVGLPQPALSTEAGQTDLLGFIYNAAKSRWLLAAFVNGFS